MFLEVKKIGNHWQKTAQQLEAFHLWFLYGNFQLYNVVHCTCKKLRNKNNWMAEGITDLLMSTFPGSFLVLLRFFVCGLQFIRKTSPHIFFLIWPVVWEKIPWPYRPLPTVSLLNNSKNQNKINHLHVLYVVS